MGFNIENLEFLLLVAAVVAMVAQQLRIPYSVGLVLAGIGLAFFPVFHEIQLTKELIFTVLLPPLLFEAAFYLHWKELRKDLLLILVLVTLGVMLSAGITTVGLHFIVHWDWPEALVFGVLIAATDPVSVIAVFKEAGARGRLRLLVEAESLFNDGTAAVGFSITVALALGHNVTSLEITKTIFMMVAGGILCGAAVAGAALLLTGRTNDHLVELTFTTVGAYGSFLLAEHFHFSGVLATITAGLMLGNLGSLGVLSDKGRSAVESFWEYAAFVANSLVFLLIGMRETRQHFAAMWLPAIVAIVLVFIGRAAAIYPTCFLFSRSSLRVSARHQHILFWGGLRGALAMALALGLPEGLPRREEIITISFAVVAFSIFVQGLTVGPLLRRLGEVPSESSITEPTK
jgi:CPA1 family monovalent cation:H+ antiporter